MPVVRNWLRRQLSDGRFELAHASPENESELLGELADAFHRVTVGHPLHLTYTFEQLAAEKRILRPEDVFDADPCPSGDIRKYYGALWARLSHAGKDALNLAAAAEFIWPVNGLGECTGIPASEIRREIGFLFHHSEVGMLPFHGSLLVFVRELPEHTERVAALLPYVASWLENTTPQYLRWGWLWVKQARIGQEQELENRPNRDWMLESLALGYPVDQVQYILRAASQLCFKNLKLERAVELRLLRDRLTYGSNHQFDSSSVWKDARSN